MTREKAIEILNSWDGVFIGYSSDEVIEAIKMADKALKQMDALDKIREEITDLPTGYIADMGLRYKVLKIINKYIEETK